MNNITNISGLEDSDINVLSVVSGCTPKGSNHLTLFRTISPDTMNTQ